MWSVGEERWMRESEWRDPRRGNGNGDGALTESERGVEREDGTDGNERKRTVPLHSRSVIISIPELIVPYPFGPRVTT